MDLPHRANIGETYEHAIMPHLDAAYRLARWLTGNEADAEDVVQEACLRAFRYFRTFSGNSARAWFLKIVRNVCWTRWNRKVAAPTDLFDEEQHSSAQLTPDPETMLLRTDAASLIDRALGNLSDRSRELIVLREIEGLSYQELADVLDIPIGTVMSGLSRARNALRKLLEMEFTQSGEGNDVGSTKHEPVCCAVRLPGGQRRPE